MLQIQQQRKTKYIKYNIIKANKCLSLFIDIQNKIKMTETQNIDNIQDRVANIDLNDVNNTHQSLNKDELYKLGLAYWKGHSNKKVDFIKAVEYFQLAVDQDHDINQKDL